MNQSEFIDWCSALQLKAVTIDVIAAIRSAPPSRRVAGRATNVSGS
ncbi:hypothetical protein [Nostoc sp. CHAB 5715]|nr:hypothetical protein [Nostoc sp. CHAB 5715]MCC5626197.1 hypothetical protein [Nostoc sp. CHAB 5715]